MIQSCYPLVTYHHYSMSPKSGWPKGYRVCWRICEGFSWAKFCYVWRCPKLPIPPGPLVYTQCARQPEQVFCPPYQVLSKDSASNICWSVFLLQWECPDSTWRKLIMMSSLTWPKVIYQLESWRWRYLPIFLQSCSQGGGIAQLLVCIYPMADQGK